MLGGSFKDKLLPGLLIGFCCWLLASPGNSETAPSGDGLKMVKIPEKIVRTTLEEPKNELLTLPGHLNPQPSGVSQGHQYRVYDAFWIHETEVPVKNYNEFAEKYQFPKITEIYMNYLPNPEDFLKPDQPAVGVSWDQASRYCAQLCIGCRLPTVAEWMFASGLWEIAVKQTYNPYRVQYQTNWEFFLLPQKKSTQCLSQPESLLNSPCAVQTGDPNQFGIYGMLGNVKEWVISETADQEVYGTAVPQTHLYENKTLEYFPPMLPEKDWVKGKPRLEKPIGVFNSQHYQLTMGASFLDEYYTGASRVLQYTHKNNAITGFRCVSPSPDTPPANALPAPKP